MASDYWDPLATPYSDTEGLSYAEWLEEERKRKEREFLEQMAGGQPPWATPETTAEKLARLRKPLPGLEPSGPLETSLASNVVQPLEPTLGVLRRAGDRSTAALIRGFVEEPIALGERIGKETGLIEEDAPPNLPEGTPVDGPSLNEDMGWIQRVKKYAQDQATKLEEDAAKSKGERQFTNEWTEAGENILEGLLAAPADILPIMVAGKAKIGMGAYMALKAYAQGKPIPEAFLEGIKGHLLGKALHGAGELGGEYAPGIIKKAPEIVRALAPPAAGGFIFGAPTLVESIAAGDTIPEALGKAAESFAVGAALSPGRVRRPFEEYTTPVKPELAPATVETLRRDNPTWTDPQIETFMGGAKIPESMKYNKPTETTPPVQGEPTQTGPPKPGELLPVEKPAYDYTKIQRHSEVEVVPDGQGGWDLVIRASNKVRPTNLPPGEEPAPDGTPISSVSITPHKSRRGYQSTGIMTDPRYERQGLATKLSETASKMTSGKRRTGLTLLEPAGEAFWRKQLKEGRDHLVEAPELEQDAARSAKIRREVGREPPLTEEAAGSKLKAGGVNGTATGTPEQPGPRGGVGPASVGGVGRPVLPPGGESAPNVRIPARGVAGGEAQGLPVEGQAKLAPGTRVTYDNQITGKPEGGVVNDAGTMVRLDAGGLRPLAPAIEAGTVRAAPEAPRTEIPRPEAYTPPTTTEAAPAPPAGRPGAEVAPPVVSPTGEITREQIPPEKPPVIETPRVPPTPEQIERHRTAAQRWVKALPELGGAVEATADGVEIRLKNGNRIYVQEEVPRIAPTAGGEQAYRELHPEIPETTNLRAHGATYRIGPNALIQIARNAEDGTENHEVTHVALDMGLVTKAENFVLGNKFAKGLAGTERSEAIAEGVAASKVPTQLKRFIHRVRSLGETLQNMAAKTGLVPEAVPSVERVVADIRTGRVLRRGAKTLEELRATGRKVPPPVAPGEPKYAIKPEEREPTPVFYSKLQRTLADKMPKVTSVDQVRGIVKSGGVKPEEVEWSGLEEFLQGKKSVSKEQLLQHLRENDVRVEEVTKGGPDRRQPTSIGQRGEQWGVKYDDGSWEWFESQVEAREAFSAPGIGPTKFSQWQLPGGENYRELLLTMPTRGKVGNRDAVTKDMYPGKKYSDLVPDEAQRVDRYVAEESGVEAPEFRGSHYDEPNILAHVRFNDRTGPNGEKILFLEEVQSDWHQKGRGQGYLGAPLTEAEGQEWLTLETLPEKVRTEEQTTRLAELDSRQTRYSDRVPNAPFKKSWPELSMKRMIRWAAENGYDKVAWTTGEQQAERYDLSKQVDAIDYARRDDGTYTLTAYKFIDARRGDEKIPIADHVPPAKLADYIGKDAAQKVVDNVGREPGVPEGSGLLEAENLKIGGEGMGGFYDQILPEVANKIGKRFGARTGETTLLTNPADGGGTPMRGAEYATVHSLDITPAMRESVVYEGQPKFKLTPEEESRAAREMEGPEGAPEAREKYRRRGAMGFGEPTQTEVRAGTEKTLERIASPERVEGKPPEEFLNFDKITSEEDVRKALKGMADAHPELMKEARGYRPQEKAAEQGKLFTQSDLNRIVKEEGRVSDAVWFQAKQTAVSGGRAVIEAAKALSDARIKGRGVDDAEADYLKVYNKALGSYLTAVRAGSEAGRALAMGNRIAEGMTKEDALFQHLLKKQANPKLIEELAKLDLSDPEVAMKAMRAASKPKVGEMIQEYVLSAMMSAPPTHIRNFISNSVMQLGKFPEKVAAGIMDAVYSGVTGKERERYASEAGKEAVALGRELWQTMHLTGAAAKAAADTWAEKGDINWGKLEATHLPALPGRAGKFVRGPLRAAGASDAWFGTIASQQEIAARSYRRAKNDVKAGKATDVTARMQEIMSDLSAHPDILTAAKKARDYWTFRDELGPRSKKVLGLLSDMGILRLTIAPFFKTPVKITGRFIERSPIGFMRALYKTMRGKYATRGEAEDEIARGLMGTMMAGAIYGMAQAGMVTGMGPKDSKKRTNKMRTGWQPYSLHLGKHYLSYQGMEPLSSLLMAVANASEVSDIEDRNKQLREIGRAVKDVAVDKTSLQGFQRVSSAIGDPERYLGEWLKGISTMPIPAIVKRGAQAIDPTVRRRDTFWDLVRGAIPGMSYDVEPRRTITGEEVRREQPALMTFGSPSQLSKEKSAPLEWELDRIGYVPSAAPRQLKIDYKPVPLNRSEMDRYAEADKAAAEEAREVIQGDEYLDAPEEPTPGIKTKQEMLEEVWRRHRAEARMDVLDMVSTRRQGG